MLCVAMVVQVKRRGNLAEVQCADIAFGKRTEPIRAVRVFGPDAQAGKKCVVLVYPAIAVGIVGRQFSKAIARARTEQLAAIVNLAVAVLVQRKNTTVGAEKGNTVVLAVGVDIKIKFLLGQFGGRSVEINDQRIFAHGITSPEREVGLLMKVAAHIQRDVELKASTVCRHNLAVSTEGCVFGLDDFFAVVIFHPPSMAWSRGIVLLGDSR